MKARTRGALVGLATMAASAGPMLATSCWDIVIVLSDMPVPCGAAEVGTPCNSCPTGLNTILPGGACEQPASVPPPVAVPCIAGRIVVVVGPTGTVTCLCVGMEASTVMNAPIVCQKACGSSTPGGPQD